MRLALLTVLLSACDGCGTTIDELRVEGEHGYVRCLAGDAPEEREWRVGEARLAIEDQTLTIEGAAPKMVAFAGPGPSDASVTPPLIALREEEPGVVLVLGSIGDAQLVANRTLADLAAVEVPVLLLAGGRDELEVWRGAFATLVPGAEDRVIDVTALERIVIGGREWIPIAGAPGGRYARTPAACGLSPEDLEQRAVALGSGDGKERALLSWAAPSGFGLLGLTGRDPGSPELARFAERVGARTGVFAFPQESASTDAATIARPLAGPAIELADGTRVRAGPVTLSPH